MQQEFAETGILKEDRGVQIKNWHVDSVKEEVVKKVDPPTTPSKAATSKQSAKGTKSETKSTAKPLPKNGETSQASSASKSKGNLKRKMSS